MFFIIWIHLDLILNPSVTLHFQLSWFLVLAPVFHFYQFLIGVHKFPRYPWKIYVNYISLKKIKGSLKKCLTKDGLLFVVFHFGFSHSLKISSTKKGRRYHVWAAHGANSIHAWRHSMCVHMCVLMWRWGMLLLTSFPPLVSCPCS